MIAPWPILRSESVVWLRTAALLVACSAHVEAPRLVLLVAEIFDGLVIEQAVDRLGVGLAVALVHLAAELIRQSVTAKVKAI